MASTRKNPLPMRVMAARRTIFTHREKGYQHLHQVQLLPQGAIREMDECPFPFFQLLLQRETGLLLLSHGTTHATDLHAKVENQNRFFTRSLSLPGGTLPGMSFKVSLPQIQNDRVIQVNHRLGKLKAKEKEKLLSEEGLMHRSQRPRDVEATFGNLKNNKNFKRFLCKGKDMTEVEFDLL